MINKIIFHLLRLSVLCILERVNQKLYMQFYVFLLRLVGVRVNGIPKYISREVYFDGSDYSLIEIGENSVISRGVIFLTHDYSYNVVLAAQGNISYIGDHEHVKLGSIRIAENSFIGANSLLLPGVSVGAFTIVGAMSLVSKDLPDRSVCAGVPCRVLKRI